MHRLEISLVDICENYIIEEPHCQTLTEFHATTCKQDSNFKKNCCLCITQEKIKYPQLVPLILFILCITYVVNLIPIKFNP